MKFSEAFKAMQEGGKVKLPSWGGYWYWDENAKTIMMKCRSIDSDTGKDLLDIRETKRVAYTVENTLSDEWIFADESNTPVLGGEAMFSFSEALKYLKRGIKVKRNGWNGKQQYIVLVSNVSYVLPDSSAENVEHNTTGNKAVAFVGTSGVQVGWLASQADMLAEDWTFAE